MGRGFDGGVGPGGLGLVPGGNGGTGLGGKRRHAMPLKHVSPSWQPDGVLHRYAQLFSMVVIPFMYAEIDGLSRGIPKRRKRPLHDSTNYYLPRRPRIVLFTNFVRLHVHATGKDGVILWCSSTILLSNATNLTVTTLTRLIGPRRLHLHRQRLR